MDRYDTNLCVGMLAILRPASVQVLAGLGVDLTTEHDRPFEAVCAAREIHPLWVMDEIARAEGLDVPVDAGAWEALQALRPTLGEWSPSEWLSALGAVANTNGAAAAASATTGVRTEPANPSMFAEIAPRSVSTWPN